MIDRKLLLNRHNPHLACPNPKSPLTVGNGEFAFTVDVTGLQTFYREQKEAHVPLCTMSQWGWHTAPAGEKRDVYFDPTQVIKTEYKNGNRVVRYASDCQPGNEEIYHWLRENPHRLNLCRLTFLWDGQEIQSSELEKVDQTLDLYEGIITSIFTLHGYRTEVKTICAGDWDVLGIRVDSEALMTGRLTVGMRFPYGCSDITASDWEQGELHQTQIIKGDESALNGKLCFHRILDRDQYYVTLNRESDSVLSRENEHGINLRNQGRTLVFTLGFSACEPGEAPEFEQVEKNSRRIWKQFWETCGMIDLHRSKDKRALELERRIILSQYLLNLQSCGSIPPQETGLTCNSWYGKFHLEMYPWHCGWAPLFNQVHRLEKSLGWYGRHLQKAKENAACNGYRGARWPKMTACDGTDSPSSIATLLIWQQPSIIYMLELAYQNGGGQKLLNEYWEVVKETADFMCDFALWNEQTGCYDLPSPLIPAQEEHNPATTKNPVFELEYWHFILHIAARWAKRLGKEVGKWVYTAEHMAPSAVKEGLYLACETCPSTFEEFNRDHPSMTGACGLIPGERIQRDTMKATLKKILACWDFNTMWGWDFAMMAMTAVRLGDPDGAIDILLKDSPKNAYVISGNNYQKGRTDLPLYLPGNGSLLLAAAMMTAGYRGCQREQPGFPDNGMWEVEYENIYPFPY